MRWMLLLEKHYSVRKLVLRLVGFGARVIGATSLMYPIYPLGGNKTEEMSELSESNLKGVWWC